MTQAPRPPPGPQGPLQPPPAVPVDTPPLAASHRMSKRAKVSLGFCGLVFIGYAYVAATGWEPATPERDEIPASVRSSPGGYRSFHFWHSGYRGGK